MNDGKGGLVDSAIQINELVILLSTDSKLIIGMEMGVIGGFLCTAWSKDPPSFSKDGYHAIWFSRTGLYRANRLG